MTAEVAHAGPWPEPEGHGLVIETFSYTQTPNHAGTFNPAFGAGTYRNYALGTYMEYGLTDDITVGAAPRLELAQLQGAEATHTTAGVSDLELFGRAVISRNGPWILAGQGLIKVPTGYDANANPAIGNGQVDLEPRLLLGRGFSLGSWPSFADLEIGYRFRLDGPDDQVRIDATLGMHPTDRWTLFLQAYTITDANQPPRDINYNLATVVVSAVYDLSAHWSVQLGGFSQIASSNYNRGNGAIGGIWWRF